MRLLFVGNDKCFEKLDDGKKTKGIKIIEDCCVFFCLWNEDSVRKRRCRIKRKTKLRIEIRKKVKNTSLKISKTKSRDCHEDKDVIEEPHEDQDRRKHGGRKSSL